MRMGVEAEWLFYLWHDAGFRSFSEGCFPSSRFPHGSFSAAKLSQELLPGVHEALGTRHSPQGEELELELTYMHIWHMSQCCGVKWGRLRCACGMAGRADPLEGVGEAD